jgi:hypothetical protein
MRRYLLLLLLALVAAAVKIAFAVHQPPAHGAEVPPVAAGTGGSNLVWRTGTMVLRLTDEDCPFTEERDQLEAEGIPPAKRYVVTQAGRKRSGCYVKDMGGDVLTLEPDGREVGTIPIDWFRREASERAT